MLTEFGGGVAGSGDDGCAGNTEDTGGEAVSDKQNFSGLLVD